MSALRSVFEKKMSESGDSEVNLARQKIYSALEMSPKDKDDQYDVLSLLLTLISDCSWRRS